MATIQEVESQIAELEATLASLAQQELSSSSQFGRLVTIGGRPMSKDQLGQYREQLQAEIANLRQIAQPFFSALEEESQARRALIDASNRAKDPKGLLKKTGTLTAAERAEKFAIQEAQKEEKDLRKRLPRLQAQLDKAEKATYNVPVAAEARDFPGSAELGAALREMGGTAGRVGKGKEGTERVTGTGGTSGAGGTGGTGRVPLTPEERKQRKQDRADARFEKAAKQLRQMAPQMAWILDIDATKYPDVRALLSRAVKDRMFESPEGIQRFTNELNGTTFFTELRDKGTKQKIVGIVGDLGFDENNMGRLLKDAVNLQWDDDTLALESYKEAFRKNADGTYVHANAEARARKSNAYLSVQNIGTAYFNQLDDATVEMVLTGGMTSEDVQRQQRELAKSKYGHLSNLIDQGLSMDAITKSYQDEAARLLEVDPNSIAMGDAKYQTAYDFVDESGQKRLMTTGEWVRKLRTDSQYGWDKTENAKQEARQLASSIVQSFGRVS